MISSSRKLLSLVFFILLITSCASISTNARNDGRFIAYDNGTVLDTKTNLMWATKDNGSGINWADAKSYCENYRGGGYTDWRMPTLDELAGLYDATKTYQSECRGLLRTYDIHLTELIRLTCYYAWASEMGDSKAAYFDVCGGGRRWGYQSNERSYRALPVLSVSSTGRLEYWPNRASTAEPGGYEKNYQIGVKKSAFIGQEIIHVKKYERTIPSALSLDTASIQFNTTRVSKTQLMIDKNRAYTLYETINLGENFYLLQLPEVSNNHWGLLISADGRISKKSLYNSSNKAVYTPEKEISIKPQNFKLLLKKTYDLPSFSLDLIYVGINDVSLNITYREYTGDDHARPAFFQSFTYKADAKHIRFKDFLIQIHEVTNEKIIYTVLEDGLK